MVSTRNTGALKRQDRKRQAERKKRAVLRSMAYFSTLGREEERERGGETTR